ncbi:MAG: NUDIX hydrolase [Candidatus Obscuribacterales bacterium]|nr:NUDIX hydrolase [Candidatus Obscuribacterales bacterium]
MPSRFNWETLSSEQIADCRVFSVNRNLAAPGGSEERAHDFYVLHPNHWVNVIPITENNEVVLIEQFRHGTGQLTLEIPGGMVDDDDPSPKDAAARELLEETGYQGSQLIHLGRNHPNPALQSNYCDTFLARGVKRILEPRFDRNEYIEIRLTPIEQIPVLIQSGRITHALVIVAFYYLNLYESTLKSSV